MPELDRLPTGVPGLDTVLKGGIPALSFNVIGGDSGTGKTTLASQILFANATEERPGLFFTFVGEPALKMLRYQQQYAFFDVAKVGSAIHFANLSEQVLAGRLDQVLEGILREVERRQPAFVVVDSFRSLTHVPEVRAEGERVGLRGFIHRLSHQLTRWEATTFLIGEFQRSESLRHPLLAVADGILWLMRTKEGDARVRRLEVSKLRGGSALTGAHAFSISCRGLRVYPHSPADLPRARKCDDSVPRLGSGDPGLDRMLGGGFKCGDAVLVSGPSGTGKTTLGMQYCREGINAGENVVIATFEMTLDDYRSRAAVLGLDIAAAEDAGRLRLVQREDFDLSTDQIFGDILDAAAQIGAHRVVIDSLSGIKIAAPDAHTFRLRLGMLRLVRVLRKSGATVLLTIETDQRSDCLDFSPQETSFLTDTFLVQRYIEIRGELKTVMAVVKMRQGSHSRAFYAYEVTDRGIVVGDPVGKHGVITGVPEVQPEGVEL